jgi:hypothetical protein
MYRQDKHTWLQKKNKKTNNMKCYYDCDESPSLCSNDCLMKNITVLICSGVDGLSIFVNFSSWFNSRKFEYIFWNNVDILLSPLPNLVMGDK